MISEGVKLKLGKTSEVVLKVAGIIGAITVIAGGYTFYLNNIWKPTVKVLDVDYAGGVAELQYGNTVIVLTGDATYLIGGDWGVRFGSTHINGQTIYNRIELTKKGMVYEYVSDISKSVTK